MKRSTIIAASIAVVTSMTFLHVISSNIKTNALSNSLAATAYGFSSSYEQYYSDGAHVIKAILASKDSDRTYPLIFDAKPSAPSATTPPTEGSSSATKRYTSGLKVAPTKRGNGDGSSWENAASLSRLPSLIKATPYGGDILILADAGSYNQTDPIKLADGGSSGKPVIVRGVTKDGLPMKAKIIGNRTAPYSPSGKDGNDLFRLYSGSDHLVFRDLSFQNIGNVFNASGKVSNLTIEDAYAKNIRRFVSNYRSSTEASSDITGLTVRHVTVEGFSKSFARINYNSSNILFEDILADSQGQDGDNFAMGFHYDGTSHDIVHRRVIVKNTIQTKSATSYWNGDGFATERGVYNVLFEDTHAMGATDGGYDLKSSKTRLVRAKASDNKRNFRLWGKDVALEHCEGRAPYKRGGSSSQAQVWAGANAEVVIKNCSFIDNSSKTVIFDLDKGAAVTVTSTKINRHSDSTFKRLDSGARLTIH